MADLVITRTIRKGGVLTDADTAPVLRDPANAFGLKREDTGAIVLAAGSALTRQSVGVYARTVTGLVAGVSYLYWIQTTVGGNTTRQEKHYTVPVASADGMPTPGSGGTWYVSAAPTARPATAAELRAHCRLDSVDASGVSDATLLMFIDAATEFAESSLSASLVPRTIVATFYDGQAIDLPRGPIINVSGVANGSGGNVAGYTMHGVGYIRRLALASGGTPPITVTYRAGYALADGITPAVPADIKLAILQHAATLYENRESVSDKPMTAVPHALEAFYARKRRITGVR